MRCSRCGNENPESHRFCGMCGASLLQTTTGTSVAPSTSSSAAGPATAAVSGHTATQVVAQPAAPAAAETPVISGPSFLGLNQPPAAPPRKRASLSIDPHSAPSSTNLDYLLEDEEPHGGGGAWKVVAILVALLLAVGLGYLRFRSHGLDGLKPDAGKDATQNTQAADSTVPAPTSSVPASTTPSAPPTPEANAAPSAASQPPADSNSAAGTGPATAAPGATATPAGSGAATGGSSPAPATTAATPDAPAGASDSGATKPAPKPADAQPAAKDAQPEASSANDAPAAVKPAPAPRASRKPAAAIKPPAAIKSVAPVDPVAEAQHYLYGKGAQQDCDRGLRILKPAAQQSNPKAMVELGALYSAGLCTPRDLPTAYRWFALALRKDPDNRAIQTDLEKLWGEMTQPERQLAIRLSQ